MEPGCTPAEMNVDEPEYTVSDEIITALDNGRTIEAIKLLRQETGLGLKEAKDAIDALARDRREESNVVSMSEEGGASGLIKLLVVIAILLAGYFYFFAG
jgi:ribosomal protein L7/L12